jgi:hypothetical protein
LYNTADHFAIVMLPEIARRLADEVFIGAEFMVLSIEVLSALELLENQVETLMVVAFLQNSE